MKGRWFSGSKTYSDSVPAVFLPVLDASNSYGYYWSSTADGSYGAYSLFFNGSEVNVYGNSRSNAYSVRCLKN